MKQVLVQKGAAILKEVPIPQIGKGELLVQVQASCLSIGTELSGIRHSGTPIWRRALQQPEKAKLAFQMAAKQGLRRTWKFIGDKRDTASPTGYSAAGIVVKVGDGVKGFSIGDRVACAGASYAYHAELIKAPVNLCSEIPEGLDWNEAATVTLGAIALQGVRRANPTLGETFVVIGLGVLGQLTSQMLKANGCRVIGMDLDETRLDLACSLGMDHAHHPENSDIEQIARLTNGYGADGVIITAATPSDKVVSNAFQVCRRKGRVVLVGDVGLNLQREDFYAKEIDFLISTSYGPGRYDSRYEEEGLDYPIGYVRWTENRNMSEYLRLQAEGKVNTKKMVSDTYPIDQATEAYASLQAQPTPLLVLLNYPNAKPDSTTRVPTSNSTRKTSTGKIRIALIGAGNFARSTHLPNIAERLDKLELRAIANRTGHTAVTCAEQFGAAYATSDYKDVLADPDVDAVIIATRHHLHAGTALEALKAGKHVLLEKPLALSNEELSSLDDYITDNEDAPILLTGYNRRFSPYAKDLRETIGSASTPFIINYRMNAGHIPPENWVHGPEGGGRNLGEACHIYDLFTYLAQSRTTKLSAHSLTPNTSHYTSNDNFVATLSFANGAVATLTYTALGSKDFPKETAELYVNGSIAKLDDYSCLQTYGARSKTLKTKQQDKGLNNELDEFIRGIEGGKWPIPWWEQCQSARNALDVEKALSAPSNEKS